MRAKDYVTAVPELERAKSPRDATTSLDLAQIDYLLALCYRRLGKPVEERDSWAAVTRRLDGLRAGMPTRDLAVNLQKLRQVASSEYLNTLSRLNERTSMVTALQRYRFVSATPAEILRKPWVKGESAAQLEFVKDLYDLLSRGRVDEPVTREELRNLLEEFDVEALLKPGDPSLNALDLSADMLLDEIVLNARAHDETAAVPERVASHGELVIQYFVGVDRVHVLTVDETGLTRWHQVVIARDELSELCEQFRNALENFSDVNALSSRLYSLLIEPLIEKAGKIQLTIYADGPLQLIPFQVLRASPEAPYLIELHYISYVSSRASPKGQPHNALTRLLTLGRLSSDGEERSEIGQLEAQVSPIRVDAITGPEDNIGELIARLPMASHVHFATHAESNRAQPNFAYLELGDGSRLYSLDLEMLDFSGKHVFLSACETLVGEVLPGEDVYGIANSFLASGASSVIATLWRVENASSTIFALRYYHNLRQSSSETEALAKTAREFIKRAPETTKGNAGLEHPGYWGAFCHLSADPR